MYSWTPFNTLSPLPSSKRRHMRGRYSLSPHIYTPIMVWLFIFLLWLCGFVAVGVHFARGSPILLLLVRLEIPASCSGLTPRSFLSFPSLEWSIWDYKVVTPVKVRVWHPTLLSYVELVKFSIFQHILSRVKCTFQCITRISLCNFFAIKIQWISYDMSKAYCSHQIVIKRLCSHQMQIFMNQNATSSTILGWIPFYTPSLPSREGVREASVRGYAHRLTSNASIMVQCSSSIMQLCGPIHDWALNH